MTAPRPTRTPRRGRIVTLVLVALAVILGGIYFAGYAMAGDRLPKNTSVDGIAIGGLTAAEAETKLATEYAPKAEQAFAVTVDGVRHEVKPADAGLTVDHHQTVLQAGAGKSLAPGHIWRVLTGGGPISPVVSTDQNKLTGAVGQLAGKVNRPAVDATVAFAGSELKRTPAAQAVELQQPALTSALKSAYLKQTEVGATTTRSDPAITDADADEVVRTFAGPAVSGPVKVDTGQGVAEVSPTMIGNASSITVDNGKLKGSTDGEKLFKEAQPAIKKLNLKEPKDASFKFDGGRPTVVPSVDGAQLGKDNFLKAVLPAVPTTDKREVKAELTPAPAKFTTEQANQQVPKEVIGQFTTFYPHADYRNTNLGLAASRINGNTVPVGGIFSLDKELGSRSSGYVDGYVIDGGKLKKENAGGISQSATTVFNAAWFAGLEDIEHQPHTLYFDRYPAGRESTIYSGSIDVQFKNTTDAAIYVEASNAKSSPGGKGSITVRIWGTKKWDVESPEPTKSNFYDGKKLVDTKPGCTPQSASPGFTASYYRVWKQNGQVIRREDKTWKYSATDEIKCEKKP
ncbi:VanW family protein [Enemella dayhoffiae]|uniref:VanW family protein n=1 Tax=Enemella dayhoffiae TaxID=2016507 RepID=UPI00159633C3|nr:VanW family protein [Enemella dayhoffiae]